MRIARLDPVADPRWVQFLARASGAGPFHHPAWLALLRRSYRYPVEAICVLDGDGEITAGVPLARVESRLTGRRLVSLPFSDACSPLLGAGPGPEASPALLEALRAERARTGLDLELRAGVRGIVGGHVVPRFLGHRLALGDDPAVVEHTMRPQVRRGIAKARREGVSVVRATDRAALETFYTLHLRTRRRQGVPTQPKSFITAFEELFALGLGFVLVSRHEGRPIAAAVFLSFGGTLLYKYGASDERHLAVRPNNLLFAEAIRAGCAMGCRELDFGRTDLDNAGLAAFKRSWGATETTLEYTYVADAPHRAGSGAASRVIAGVIRRSPPLAGRAIGTALYRHVG